MKDVSPGKNVKNRWVLRLGLLVSQGKEALVENSTPLGFQVVQDSTSWFPDHSRPRESIRYTVWNSTSVLFLVLLRFFCLLNVLLGEFLLKQILFLGWEKQRFSSRSGRWWQELSALSLHQCSKGGEAHGVRCCFYFLTFFGPPKNSKNCRVWGWEIAKSQATIFEALGTLASKI